MIQLKYCTYGQVGLDPSERDKSACVTSRVIEAHGYVIRVKPFIPEFKRYIPTLCLGEVARIGSLIFIFHLSEL